MDRIGVCETCGYRPDCGYAEPGRSRCYIVTIQECKEVVKTKAFQGIYDYAILRHDDSVTVKNLYKILSAIQYTSTKDTPGWEVEEQNTEENKRARP